MRLARAKEHSKHLLRPGDMKFLPWGREGAVIISGFALMVYKGIRAGLWELPLKRIKSN